MGLNVSTHTAPAGTTPIVNSGVAVNLVLDKSGFCLGDIVQGYLTVSPVMEVIITRISVELVCQCQTELCETSTSTTDSHHSHNDPHHHSTTVTHYHYLPYTMEPLHTQPIDVFNVLGGAVFSTLCSVPFRFPIPAMYVPSTLQTVMGHIHPIDVKYHFIVNTFGATGYLLHSVRSELKVFSAYAYPNPERPLMSYANVRSALFCCIETNMLVVFCTTNKTVYCPGDQVFLSYWYQTDKPDTVPYFRLSVNMKMHTSCMHPPGVRLNYGTPYPTAQKYTLLEQPLTRPEANTMCQASVTLPQDCGPEHSNDLGVFLPLTWKYEFYVKIKLDRLCDSVIKVSLPIVINGKNAEQLLQLDRPLQGMALPAASVAAQQYYISSAMSAVPSPQPPPHAAAAAAAVAYASSDTGVTGTTVVDDIHANNYSINGVTYVTVPVVE